MTGDEVRPYEGQDHGRQSASRPQASLRGELITRDDKDAFTAARFRGWNRDLDARANALGFVVASGVRDIATPFSHRATR